MYRTRLLLLVLTILLTTQFPACRKAPTIPETNPLSDPTVTRSQADNPVHQSLGFYFLTVDTQTLEIEALPLRTADWHFNLTGILNSTMGVSAAGVPSEHDPPNGLFVFDITLTHPFATQTQFTGFDVKGILMTPGSLAIGPLIFADAGETELVNADGYTRWWNAAEFTQPGIFGYTPGVLANASIPQLTATVNPYKLFADILAPEDSLAWVSDEPLDSDQGRAVFTAGSANTRRYRIRFPMDPGPQIVFGYAIDCSWSPPAPNPPAEVPDDFPIHANQPEAYRIGLIPTGNSLYFDTESGIGGGVLKLQINIHDWQGHDAGYTPPEIEAVRIFAPDLMPGGVDGVFRDDTGTKARYTVDLFGLTTVTGPGEVKVICRVGSTDGTTYQQAAAPAPDSSLSAFHAITIDIPDPVCQGDATNDWAEALDIDFGDSVSDQVCLPDDYRDFYTFDIDLGHATSGEIRLYSDAEPTILGLYDSSETLVSESDISGGIATIDLDPLELNPDQYYIRVWTNNSTQVAPYLLELDAEHLNRIPENVVDVTPPGLYVEPYNIWLHENYALMLGSGYWVCDLSDPANPDLIYEELISRIGMGSDSCFNYPYCFVEKTNVSVPRLDVIDFSDPANPVRYEDVILPGDYITALCMNSTHLYTVSGSDPVELTVYEYASNPSNPTEVGSLSIPGMDYARELGLIDPVGPDTHLVVGTETRMDVYSVEDPGSITAAGGLDLPASYLLNDMVVWEDFIYVVDASEAGSGWLDIFEFTDLGVDLRGSVNLPGSAEGIAVDFPRAYIGDGLFGLAVCNVTDPSSPTFISNDLIAGEGWRVGVNNDLVCVVPQGSAMWVFDRADPDDPEFLSRLIVTNDPQHGAEFSGDYMFVPDSSMPYSVNVINVSDPADAFLAEEFSLGLNPRYLCMDGDVIAVAGEDLVMLLDAGSPPDLGYLGMYSTDPNEIDGLAMRDNALYVMINEMGTCTVTIVRISDPTAPSYYNTFTYDECRLEDYAFYGDTMYVPTYDGFRIYNVSSPLSPDYLDTYTASGSLADIAIQGSLLYMRVSPDSVEIADLTVPASPAFVGSGPAGWEPFTTDMAVDGQFAYCSGNSVPPIRACWVYPPETPTPYAVVYPKSWHCYGLWAHDGYLYERSGGLGIRIYDLYDD